MYTLELYDGSKIQGLQRVNPRTFILKSNDSSIYWQLSENNLSFALLWDENDSDILVDYYINYSRQNFMCQGDGFVQFRIAPTEEVWREPNRVKKKWKGAKL